MPNDPAPLTRIFHALADPTLRAVVERLARGPARMRDLASPFQMALPSFKQHLDLLEQAGLVRSRRTGRERLVELAPDQLDAVDHWLSTQRSLWTRRLDQLDSLLLTLKDPPP